MTTATPAPLDPEPWLHTNGERSLLPLAPDSPEGGATWKPRTEFEQDDRHYTCVCGALLGCGACSMRAHQRGPRWATPGSRA